jgi:hypothetical protein
VPVSALDRELAMPALRARADLLIRMLLSVLLLAVPSIASAQLDEGRRLLEEADFEGAIAALDRAEQQDGLTREEVVSLFEARAIARRANGDAAGARADLEALASLDPEHVFPAEAPPELADELRAIAAAPLSVTAEWDDEEGERATVHAAVTGDTRGLVTSIVIWTRSGATPWRRSSGPSATVEARAGRVEGYVEAIGPGGAVIASAGSRSAPIVHAIGTAETATPEGAPPRSDDTLLHIGIAAGAGALALVIVIAVAVAVSSQPSSQTRLDGPIIVGF